MFLSELRRALMNIRMLSVILVSLCLLYLSAYNTLLSTSVFIDSDATDLSVQGLEKIHEFGKNKYHIWTQSYIYLQTIFIFAAVLPFTASYIQEKNSKYHYLQMIRVGERKYRAIKFLVNCLAGGIALLLPEIIYYIFLTLLARNKVLEPFTFHPEGLYSNLFTETPDLYIFFIFGVHFLIGFAFAGFAYGISSFFTKNILAYVIPFGFYLTYDIIVSNNEIMNRYALTNLYNFMSSTDYSLSDFSLAIIGMLVLGISLYYINYRMVNKYG
ncbi:ABC transporter permease [Paenibacillus tarimensis]